MVVKIFLFLFIFSSLWSIDKKLLEVKKTNLFNLHTFSFFKNSELETNSVKGKTTTGVQLFPYLYINKEKNIFMTLGYFGLKYSSVENFTNSSIFFSVEILPKDNFSILLGSFFETTDFINPLYSDENLLTQRKKEGIKLSLNSKESKVSLWIDWRKFIFDNSPFQEEFTVGFSIDKKREKKLSFPLFLLINHKGGEIDASDSPVRTSLNPVVGISIPLGKKIEWETDFLGYLDDCKESNIPFKQGGAFYSVFKVKLNNTTFDIFSFFADRYYSEFGDPLFWTVSKKEEKYKTQRRRNFGVNFKFQEQLINDLVYSFELETNYDTIQSRLNYTYALFIKYNLDSDRGIKWKK